MEEDAKFPSDLADRFQVRMPSGMRDRLAARAKAHGRSSNTEALFALSMWLDQADWIDAKVRGEEVGPWPGVRPDPLPEELRLRVVDAAKTNGRSADEEIIARLKMTFDRLAFAEAVKAKAPDIENLIATMKQVTQHMNNEMERLAAEAAALKANRS